MVSVSKSCNAMQQRPGCTSIPRRAVAVTPPLLLLRRAPATPPLSLHPAAPPQHHLCCFAVPALLHLLATLPSTLLIPPGVVVAPVTSTLRTSV
jgi:hypothetical protein